MYSFYNDYARAAHPAVLKKLAEKAALEYPGYGEDEATEEAAALIRRWCGLSEEATVRFFTGGTISNATALAFLLHPAQSVITAETSHINYHEAGAIELSGHRIADLPQTDGKITSHQIKEHCLRFLNDPTCDHMVEPGAVYLSQPTEVGTLYTKKELTDIAAVCRQYSLALYIDGARLGYGLASPKCDVTIRDIADLADVFCIGGTKQGTLMGEAVVFTHSFPGERRLFSFMKQRGAVLAKGWLLALQFQALLENDDYLKSSKRADECALRIRDALEKHGFQPEYDSWTNQQFFCLPDEALKKLSEEFAFDVGMSDGKGHTHIRICTAWYTTEEETDKLIDAIEKAF